MNEQVLILLVEAVLVFAVVLAGLRIMLGRATVPVLVGMALCSLSTVFPNDPFARAISAVSCRFAIPILLLWGLFHLLKSPTGAPPRSQGMR
ncbi:MAG TPA: hypothetical protein PLD73_07350 [Candidatus Hydrogenedentes bacterium]|jgi:hypothetical protein|nr:hypothetical protein [Candidatus Hydrogenedentota bacterium]HPJ97902.1 hypothetical protein [Candidatus Hydrogenedentota bacterium]